MSETAIPTNDAVDLEPEDQSYVDQMIARAEGEAPKKFADKFDSVEALEQAYRELQSKLGQRGQEPSPPPAATPGEPPAPTAEKPAEPPATVEQAKEAVEQAGLDFSKLEGEFRETGDISAASRAELAKRGIGPEMVDAFLAGQRAAETLGRQKVFEAVGGEQTYRAMIAWAQANLSAEEIEAYNEVAAGTNFAALRLAAAGLHARFEAANGTEPRLVTGDSSAPAENVFQSWAQVRAAMNDPRYDVDEAYRASVEQKLARSAL